MHAKKLDRKSEKAHEITSDVKATQPRCLRSSMFNNYRLLCEVFNKDKLEKMHQCDLHHKLENWRR